MKQQLTLPASGFLLPLVIIMYILSLMGYEHTLISYALLVIHLSGATSIKIFDKLDARLNEREIIKEFWDNYFTN